MFTLAKSPDYWWPVIVNTPGDDGTVVTAQFDGRFKRLTQSEHDALVARIIVAAPDAKVTDADMARQIMIGWRGVNDASGASIDFTDGTFAQLLDIQGVATAICKAFNASLRKAAEKN